MSTQSNQTTSELTATETNQLKSELLLLVTNEAKRKFGNKKISEIESVIKFIEIIGYLVANVIKENESLKNKLTISQLAVIVESLLPRIADALLTCGLITTDQHSKLLSDVTSFEGAAAKLEPIISFGITAAELIVPQSRSVFACLGF